MDNPSLSTGIPPVYTVLTVYRWFRLRYQGDQVVHTYQSLETPKIRDWWYLYKWQDRDALMCVLCPAHEYQCHLSSDPD